jgi:DMSO/TMAO reductase YedYZ heme-binding membrane subunit
MTNWPDVNAGVRSAPQRKRTIDTWASGDMPVIRTTRQMGLLWLLGAPALLPLAFEMRGILTLNGGDLHGSGNDVLGTGGALLLFAMLAITPLRTLTRRQWFVPLRRWYGVVLAFNIFADAIIASNDTAFNGPIGAKLAEHTFLILGLLMTLLLIPLTVMGIWNQRTFRQLGKYWKPVQQYGTYAVWGILGLHLLLLEGFGVRHGDALGPDRFPFDVLHQRFYEFLGCSALMLTLRLPPVRRWIRARQNAGKTWQVWLTIAPLVIVFLLAYGYFVNELMDKGIAAYNLNPIND